VISSFLQKLRTFKAGLEMMPPMLERLESACVSKRVEELMAHKKYEHPASLIPSRFQVYSQYGQDGIIDEIFRRIGKGSRRFVEIGTAPLENNTGFLLLQGWSGLWIDAALPSNEEMPPGVQERIQAGCLRCERRFVNKENMVPLLREQGFDQDLDFLGVDVDRNTYYILEPCLELRPRVLAVEYNAQLPPAIDWVVPYDPEAVWDKTRNYGASLKALERLVADSGYALVGCELSGTDAFFVREDLLGDHFHPPFTAEHHWEPARFWIDSRKVHEAAFFSGTARQ